jgi:TonB-dependent starch-binding outer membrane protein SusC
MSDEIFMQDIKWLSNLKLRGSYGSVGNSNIGLYRSLATYTIGNYPIGQSINPGVYATGLENTDLKWETTVTSEVAVDFRLFNRVNFTIDAYNKKTNDLLMYVSLIETSGQLTALRNVGELQNKGFEFSADAVIIEKAVVWRLKADFFTNKSKILKLNGDASQAWKIGQPVGVERGPLIDGIFETQADLDNYIGADGKVMNGAKLGDYRTVDTNKDGKISGEDNAIIYDPNPKFTYSFTNDISYKNFSLNIFTYGTYGNQVRNITTGNYLTNLRTIRTNLSKDVVGKYWTPENPTGVKYPKLGSITEKPLIEDGSFLRIQNIVLSYTIPIRNVKSARIYVSGQNLITLTNYSGYDPDVTSPIGVKVGGGVVSNTTIGYDNASYPTPRGVTFGLDITF